MSCWYPACARGPQDTSTEVAAMAAFVALDRGLDQWRITGFDPKTVTHCGTCKAQFKLQVPSDAKGAQHEVWVQIAWYIGNRIACFFAVVLALGFIPPMFLGVDETRVLKNSLLNHISLGTFSTFGLAGGWAFLQLLWSVNLLGFRPDRWGFDSKDSFNTLIVIVVIVGALYLIYKLVEGIWEIAQSGHQVASANIRHTNKEMRTRIVQRYPVMNYEQCEKTTDGSAGCSAPLATNHEGDTPRITWERED
ncbi:unnamed protein product [Polarella glacialis]|uniref:Uncharacterized protein n=1 Tax=Polarella glacialis TaxID=89957 RepID=A0A813LLP9_POLGL|nr:unnamed protein product [Polarella glacialis]